MDTNLSLYEINLNFYFVSDGNDASEQMGYARMVSNLILICFFVFIDFNFSLQNLREHIPDGNIHAIDHADCRKYTENATKKDIFIFDKFSGKAFEVANASRAL